MGLKLKEGEYLELEFKAFNWAKWGKNLSGSWDRFYITNQRIVLKTPLIPITQSIPWEDVYYMGRGEKGLRIEGKYKGFNLVLDINSKKLSEDTIFQFEQIARSYKKFGKPI